MADKIDVNLTRDLPQQVRVSIGKYIGAYNTLCLLPQASMPPELSQAENQMPQASMPPELSRAENQNGQILQEFIGKLISKYKSIHNIGASKESEELFKKLERLKDARFSHTAASFADEMALAKQVLESVLHYFDPKYDGFYKEKDWRGRPKTGATMRKAIFEVLEFREDPKQFEYKPPVEAKAPPAPPPPPPIFEAGKGKANASKILGGGAAKPPTGRMLQERIKAGLHHVETKEKVGDAVGQVVSVKRKQEQKKPSPTPVAKATVDQSQVASELAAKLQSRQVEVNRTDAGPPMTSGTAGTKVTATSTVSAPSTKKKGAPPQQPQSAKAKEAQKRVQEQIELSRKVGGSMAAELAKKRQAIGEAAGGKKEGTPETVTHK